MSRGILILLGLVAVVLGAIWTAQGLGYLKGSPMTGVSFWALAGPIVSGLGVALTIVGVRRPKG